MKRWTLCALLVLAFSAGAGAQNLEQPDKYPKAKSKTPVVEKGSSAERCLQGMTRIGSGFPRSEQGINYPNKIGDSPRCPVGGPYLYSRDPEQPGNDPGFQCYFLIRCRAPEHASIGYNSIDGPVNPSVLKTFKLR